jgi:hypothetical protein
MDDQNVSITYNIEELPDSNYNHDKVLEIEKLLKEIESEKNNDDLCIPQMINYQENFTVKELLLICEYYGFAKDLKNNKCNKEQIIQCLVLFETNPDNSDIVFKRQNMWFYINELKSDKYMKKFVLW